MVGKQATYNTETLALVHIKTWLSPFNSCNRSGSHVYLDKNVYLKNLFSPFALILFHYNSIAAICATYKILFFILLRQNYKDRRDMLEIFTYKLIMIYCNEMILET